MTLAFLPYADGLPAMTAAARARGHEIFVHLPMEPIGSPYPGPNAILVDLDPAELQHRITWAFDRVPLATGVNNHMGSRATSDPETMLTVLREVRRRGLEFVDSRTSPMSVGDGLAAQLGIPHAARDVFLDNNPTADAIQHMLAGAERLGAQARLCPGDRPPVSGDAGRAPAVDPRSGGARTADRACHGSDRQAAVPGVASRSRSAPATGRTARRRPAEI